MQNQCFLYLDEKKPKLERADDGGNVLLSAILLTSKYLRLKFHSCFRHISFPVFFLTNYKPSYLYN
jgi:hypothetical protein